MDQNAIFTILAILNHGAYGQLVIEPQSARTMLLLFYAEPGMHNFI